MLRAAVSCRVGRLGTALAVFLGLAANQALAQASFVDLGNPPEACRQLASHAVEADAYNGGVALTDINTDLALGVCAMATSFPDAQPADSFRAGRVLEAIGNHAAAEEMYLRSVGLRYAPAYVNLAMLYVEGVGVEKNIAGALALLEAAHEADARAPWLLGEIYMYSDDPLFQNYEKARRFFLICAQGGDADCQLQYGVLLANGWGGWEDRDAAKTWLARAAAQTGESADLARRNLAELERGGGGGDSFRAPSEDFEYRSPGPADNLCVFFCDLP